MIKDARGKVIYVGITDRGSHVRLGEHLQKKLGEFMGRASEVRVVGINLTPAQQNALEQSLIQEYKPIFNNQTRNFNPADVPGAYNANIVFKIVFGY